MYPQKIFHFFERKKNKIKKSRTWDPELKKSVYEALREKVLQLGKLHEILSKFHILKMEFLHEKIIFFGLDFFPDKVWLCSVRK